MRFSITGLFAVLSASSCNFIAYSTVFCKFQLWGSSDYLRISALIVTHSDREMNAKKNLSETLRKEVVVPVLNKTDSSHTSSLINFMPSLTTPTLLSCERCVPEKRSGQDQLCAPGGQGTSPTKFSRRLTPASAMPCSWGRSSLSFGSQACHYGVSFRFQILLTSA